MNHASREILSLKGYILDAAKFHFQLLTFFLFLLDTISNDTWSTKLRTTFFKRTKR